MPRPIYEIGSISLYLYLFDWLGAFSVSRVPGEYGDSADRLSQFYFAEKVDSEQELESLYNTLAKDF